jgi:hypothetical protein
MRIISCAVLVLFCILSGRLEAAITTINSFDNGWYRSDGFHNPPNTNTFTGFATNSGYHRSFYVFNLASLAGMNVTNVTIKFFVNGTNLGNDLSKELGQFGSEESIDALLDGTGGLAVYNDLGGGTSYGAIAVTKAVSETTG